MALDETKSDIRSIDQSRSVSRLSRGEFLRMASLCQGGLLVAAIALAWLAGIKLFDQLLLTPAAVMWGVTATLPMLLMFVVMHRYPVGPFRGVQDFLSDTLGPTLADCNWLDLAYLSLMAGVSEELLFRGVAQTWLTASFGVATALIVSNLLFGLAHAVSVFYVVLAGLLGLYLATVFTITGEANLVPPMLCHALYDFIALSVYRREALNEASSAR